MLNLILYFYFRPCCFQDLLAFQLCVQPKRVAVSSNHSNLASARQNPSAVRSSSIANAHFDYAELAVDSNQASSSADNEHFDFNPAMAAASSSDSLSQSTAGDAACWETPFAQESLGNTVIHFDTVCTDLMQQYVNTFRWYQWFCAIKNGGRYFFLNIAFILNLLSLLLAPLKF